MQLAWALQYDARPSDEELVRHVLEAEVEWRERDPWQGVGETLEIVAWLVARQRRVEDVWMLARAKAANFDTACGFDREHLLAAGVTQTLRYVRGSERPERDEVLALLLDEGGAPLYDQAEINAWHARRARTFQSSPDREEPAVGIDRALAIGDRSSARLFLDAWSARQEPSAAFYGELASRWEELEGWGQAASARRERLARLDDSFARVGELCSLARAERRAGRPLDAFDALLRAAEEHTHIARWRAQVPRLPWSRSRPRTRRRCTWVRRREPRTTRCESRRSASRSRGLVAASDPAP